MAQGRGAVQPGQQQRHARKGAKNAKKRQELLKSLLFFFA
jgi:hypothetical protein